MNLTDDVLAIEELRRAVASGVPETVAITAVSNIWPLYSAHFAELTTAIEALPLPVLERYPVLRVVHRMTPVLARSTRPFKPLMSPDLTRTMSADELDVLTLAQMIAFRFSGDVAAAMIYARRLEDRVLQLHADARDRTDGPLWYYHQQIGSTLLAAGLSGRALLQFATARQLGRLAPQVDAERMALGRAAIAYAVRGSLDDADRALAAARLRPPATGAHVSSTATTECATAALIEVERMTPEAEGRLDGLEPYDSIELSWPFALLARTRWFGAQQRPEEAMEAVRLASDAHPDQHGSFASDVVAAASIDALCSLGATASARRLVETSVEVGPLTRLAIVRHALLEARFTPAEQGLRRLGSEQGLGPGQRAEVLLLSVWLESARNDGVTPDSAQHVLRLSRHGGARRMLATMPIQVVDHVRAALPEEDGGAFEESIAGLLHIDVPPRPILTTGELRVLGALHERATTQAIALSLQVSPNTIKSQLRTLYRKLGCTTRDEAIRIASRLHLTTYDV